MNNSKINYSKILLKVHTNSFCEITDRHNSATLPHLTKMMTKTPNSSDHSNSFGSIYDDDRLYHLERDPTQTKIHQINKIQIRCWIKLELLLTCSIPRFSVSSAAEDKSRSKAIWRRRRSNFSFFDICGGGVDVMVFVVADVVVSAETSADVAFVVGAVTLISVFKNSYCLGHFRNKRNCSFFNLLRFLL